MKKRILSLIIAIVLILPCFTLNVFATSVPAMPTPYDNADFDISDDYQTLTFNGTTYIRFDASVGDWDYSDSHIDRNCTYLDNVDYIDYEFSINNSIITAHIYFSDDSYFYCSFIKESLLPEYNNMLNSASQYIIEFNYPSDAKIPIKANQLSTDSATIEKSTIDYLDSYSVYVYSNDESFWVQKGDLVIIDNEYYYVDFKLNNLTNSNKYDNDMASYTAYKVIDPELIAQLDKETGNSQDEFIDLLFSGELFTGFGTLLLIAIFALIPLVVLVLFIILSIRAKTPAYKKLFRAIYIISASELLTFIISVILLIISK